METFDYTDPFGENVEAKGKYYAMVVLTNKKLLSDDTFTDLVIKVGSDTVTAHAPIVCCRCEEIITFGADDRYEKAKKQKKKLEIKIKDGAIASGAIMSKVLEYIYTGVVDFPKLTDKDILFLVKASRFFKLNRLSYLCERWLNEHMTIESVFHLLRAATDSGEDRIKGFCLQFALQNYNSFISNKDGIYILGIELFQEVVAAFQTNPAPPTAIAEPPDTLLDDFKRLYNDMPYSDFILPLPNENIKCHKAILAAHSDVFVATLFRETDGFRITPEAFKSVLKFLYYGEDSVEALPACELVPFCRKFKLPALLRIAEDKIRNSVNANTVIPILSISYLGDGRPDLTDELRNKCIPFILQNLDKIDLRTIQTCNPLMIVDLLLDLQSACKRKDYGLPSSFKAGGAPVQSRSHHVAAAGGGAPAGGNAPVAPPREFAPPSREDSSSSIRGAPGRPVPPPRGGVTKEPSGGFPPPPSNMGVAPPPPPPRSGSNVPSFPPPPVGGGNSGPPTPVRETSQNSLQESSEESAGGSKGKLTRKKSEKSLGGDLTKKGAGTAGKKDKKEEKRLKEEEEKRKKDEAKRIAKEKKERQKMEKKFKGGKEIF